MASLKSRATIASASKRGSKISAARRRLTSERAPGTWTGNPNSAQLREDLEREGAVSTTESARAVSASANSPPAAAVRSQVQKREQQNAAARAAGGGKSLKDELQALGFNPVDEGPRLSDGGALSLLTNAQVYKPATAAAAAAAEGTGKAVTGASARGNRRAGLAILQDALKDTVPPSTPASTFTFSAVGWDQEVNREEGKDNIIPYLEACATPSDLNQLLDQIFPRWASNGYRLLCVSTGVCVPAPTPAEAAHALKVIAQSAKKVKMSKFDTMELARDRVVLGLVEALRVTPPRSADSENLPAELQVPGSYWIDPVSSLEVDELSEEEDFLPMPSAEVSGSSGNSDDGPAGLTRVADPQASNMLDAPSLAERLLSHTRASTSSGVSPTSSSDAVGSSISSLLSKYQTASRQPAAPSSVAPRADNSLSMTSGRTATSATDSLRTSDEDLMLPVDLSASLELPALSLPEDKGMEYCKTLGADAFAVPVDPAEVEKVQQMQSEFGERDQIKHVAFSWAVWALSVLGGPTAFSEEMDALLKLARWKTWGFQTYELSNIVWALANARHWSPVLPALESRILAHGGLSKFKPPETAALLWGFARLGYVPIRLLDTIRVGWGYKKSRQKAVKSGKPRGGLLQFTPGQLTSIAWALAVMQQTHRPCFREIWQEVCSRYTSVTRSPQQLTQVWQAALAARLDGSWDSLHPDTVRGSTLSSSTSTSTASAASNTAERRVGGLRIKTAGSGDGARTGAEVSGQSSTMGRSGHMDGVTGGEAVRKLLAAAEAAFKEETSGLHKKVQSQYQRQLADALADIGLVHVIEDDSSGYAIDVTVPALRVAIEADGPSHTARNDPQRLLGHTQMKRRHLTALGWHLISVPHWEWDLLPNQLARINYLEQKMDEVLPEETKRPWVKKWSARPVPLDF